MLLTFPTYSELAGRAGGFDHMSGLGWAMVIFGWVFMVAIVGLVVWLIVSTTRGPDGSAGARSAIDVLGERYARGEIDSEEYMQRRTDLES